MGLAKKPSKILTLLPNKPLYLEARAVECCPTFKRPSMPFPTLTTQVCFNKAFKFKKSGFKKNHRELFGSVIKSPETFCHSCRVDHTQLPVALCFARGTRPAPSPLCAQRRVQPFQPNEPTRFSLFYTALFCFFMAGIGRPPELHMYAKRCSTVRTALKSRTICYGKLVYLPATLANVKEKKGFQVWTLES